MKAEEKFPHLADNAITWHHPGSVEIRELFDFWDAHQWHPMADHPPNGTTVLLWAKKTIPGFYDKDHQECFTLDGNPINHATHWMPLPKGPK